jgi:hypothetical protein
MGETRAVFQVLGNNEESMQVLIGERTSKVIPYELYKHYRDLIEAC